MKNAAWFAAIAACDAAIRIQPEVAGPCEARRTACMYAGRHDEALADYTTAVELELDDAGHWRRRAHAHSITPTPQPHPGVKDASRAIHLDPHHPTGCGHRAIALTQLPTPDWQRALADMNRHIELFPKHDPEAYRLRSRVPTLPNLSLRAKRGNLVGVKNAASGSRSPRRFVTRDDKPGTHETGYGRGYTITSETTPRQKETAGWLSSCVAAGLGLNRTALVVLKPVTRTAKATLPADWPTSGPMWDRPDPVGSVFPEMVP